MKRTFENNISMIARIWHGTTNIGNYGPYTDFLRKKAMKSFKNTKTICVQSIKDIGLQLFFAP